MLTLFSTTLLMSFAKNYDDAFECVKIICKILLASFSVHLSSLNYSP